MEVLANARVVIILQNTSVSNQHTGHPKLTGCYVSIISQQSWKNTKKIQVNKYKNKK